MKKRTYFIGGIIALILIVGVGFLLIKKDTKQNYSEPEVVATQNMKTDRDKEKIIAEFNVKLNGKLKEFTVEYEVLQDEYYASIRGKMTGIKEKISFDSVEDDIDKFVADNFKEKKISAMMGVDDFHIIKGEDNKDYLLVTVRTNHFISGKTDYLYVFNDELELVTGDIDYNGCSNDEAFTIRIESSGHKSDEEPGKSGYKDENDTLGYKNLKEDYYLNLKIEDNKIYYLKAKQKLAGENDYGTLEERVYTIKNNKLEYTVKNTFKITWVAGVAC